MAQVIYRANLTAKGFPFDPLTFGRSVIIPVYDQNFNRQVQGETPQDGDIGIPQAFTMQNYVPTANGYAALSKRTINFPADVPALPTPVLSDGDAVYVKHMQGFLPTSQINFYVLRIDFAEAVLHYNTNISNPLVDSGIPPIYGDLAETFDRTPTLAQVNGRLFLAFPQLPGSSSIYEVTQAAPLAPLVFTLNALSGFVDPGGVVGIFNSRGYLCWWNDNAIGWSSTLDPLDHAPSIITGAGNTQVQQARGKIVHCVETLWGFLVYCTDNIVSAEYTGNLQNPWIFREVHNSSGITSYRHVTKDASLDIHYAFTKTGFIKIVNNQSTEMLPELYDMVTSGSTRVIPQFINTPLEFYPIDQRFTQRGAIFFIAKRYLVFSVGLSNWGDPVGYPGLTPAERANVFELAYIYDTLLDRWGMLRVRHTYLFSYQLGESFQDSSKQWFAYMQADGTFATVNPARVGFLIPGDPNSVESMDFIPTIYFGRYALNRTQWCTLQRVEIEFGEIGIAGADLSNVVTELQDREQYNNSFATFSFFGQQSRQWNLLATGRSHTLIFTFGTIESLVLTFSQHGRM